MDGGAGLGPQNYDRLSPREHEIVELASDGLTNREIAQRIGLAEASVKGVLARLMRRFDCDNRLQLIARVERHPPDAAKGPD